MKKLLSLLLVFVVALMFCACESKNNQSSAGVVTIDFFVTNDLHGNVIEDTGLGISRTSTILNARKKSNPNTIFMSSGDMWQGSSESNNTKGKLVTEWMNTVGFTSMTLGNHEFDWGTDYISNNAQLAEFPFLAINVYNKTTDEIADFCQPSVMVEKGGVSIGIIGAIGDCYSSISSSKVTDYYFKTGDELTELVKEESKSLKSQGADVIVYSLHDGSSNRNSASLSNAPVYSAEDMDAYYDISLSEGYVDLVFEAHTHQGYLYKDSKGVYHMQGMSDNRAFSHVTTTYNTKKDKFAITAAEVYEITALTTIDKDEQTESLFEKYSAEIGPVYEVLGYNAKTLNSYTLKQLCANLYLKAGLERWGDKYNIFLGGGFISCRSPYYLYKGNVCYKDIQSLFPFDNDIVLCTIKGSYLKSQFTETTNSNYYIAYSAYGSENKKAIQDDETYYVVTDSYSSDYKWNRLTVVEKYSEEEIYARDLIAAYVKSGALS